MVHCFFTGVETTLQEARVLNRRAARDLLDELRDKVAGLQRIVMQTAPMDEAIEEKFWPGSPRFQAAPKRHRLVCKAVADAMAAGFPEIELFITWAQYVKQSRKTVVKGFREHPTLGEAAKRVDDDALLYAGKKGRRVLYLLDQLRVLSANTRQAIGMGSTTLLRPLTAEAIAELICKTALENGDPDSVGLTQNQLSEVRTLPRVVQMATKPEQSPQGGTVPS
jgi:hypothetical protein